MYSSGCKLNYNSRYEYLNTVLQLPLLALLRCDARSVLIVLSTLTVTPGVHLKHCQALRHGHIHIDISTHNDLIPDGQGQPADMNDRWER